VSSQRGMAIEWKVDFSTVGRAIEALQSELGEVGQYRFGANFTDGYTPQQKSMIYSYLEKRGIFNRAIPEGAKQYRTFAKELEIGTTVLDDAIQATRDQLGEIGTYMSGNRPSFFIMPEQQDILENYLLENDKLLPVAPPEIKSINMMGTEWNISNQTIANVLKEIDDQIGKTKRYRFYSQRRAGYNPEQQALIKQALIDRQSLIPPPPEGAKTEKTLIAEFKVSLTRFRRAVQALKNELGDINFYKFYATPAAGYLPHQQDLIRQHLANERTGSSDTPSNDLDTTPVI
jgi:hypothetical protein